MTPRKRHPAQRLVKVDGVVRFEENAIVRYLLDKGPFDMNHLAELAFSDEDRTQFAELIGYPWQGFGELDYVSGREWQRVQWKYRAGLTK